MLVDKHAKGDPVGVEAIQEILNVAADKRVKPKLLLILNHPLGHGGNHVIVSVPNLDEQLQKAKGKQSELK